MESDPLSSLQFRINFLYTKFPVKNINLPNIIVQIGEPSFDVIFLRVTYFIVMKYRFFSVSIAF